MDEEAFTFGSFRLIPAQRVLFEDGKPLRLGSRALDILVALVERAGNTIPKEELIARAWPDMVIEEAALRVHVAALRKVLGDGRASKRYIANFSGRGYAFIAPVTRENGLSSPAAPIGMAEAGNLPALLTRVVGRDGVISSLAEQLVRRRFLTIVGPGGIGKTMVAVAVANRARESYKDGAWFVGLASLSDPNLVPSAVGTVLGVSPSGSDHTRALAAWLRDKHILIVLDNCEHVIGAVAALAEAILKAAPHTGILATSREPLRAEGEWLHRLAPLELPPQGRTFPTAAEALGYSAVELFNERATAITDSFVIDDTSVPAVLEICRRLDGMPLALELAAARVHTLGIGELAVRLDNRFGILTNGRRTALPRQQTLRATIDWSYDLLPEPERRLLRYLAVFAGGCTLEAIAAVAEGADLADVPVIENMANLVAKSLVVLDASESPNQWRMLETIRAYAIQKLAESGEHEVVAKRHAQHYRDLFERAAAEAEMLPTDKWLPAYRPHIDNLRAALQWAFSPEGDVSIGVALAVAAIPLWIKLSMMAECRHHVERALALLNSSADRDPQCEMQLHAALGMSLNYTTGPVSTTAAAWTRTLEIAKSLDNTEYQLRAFRGLWAHHMNAAEYRRALAFAQEFRGLAAASADPTDLVFGDRMAALMLHYLGDQEGARRHLEYGSLHAAGRQSQTSRFLLDREITVQALLARIFWLQGFPDEAARTARSAVDRALATGHALSLCHALGQAACPVAHFIGDLAWAEESVAILLDNARERGLSGWIARGHCFLGMAMISQRDFAGGLPLLRDALADLSESGSAPGYPAFLAVLAAGLGRAGQVIEGLTVINQALTLAKGREEHWCVPELLRSEGELHLLEDQGKTARSNAEDCFRQALEWAQRDGVLAWELRIALNLARLWRGQGRSADAIGILQPVYDRFTEGFDTADLRAARALLDTLR